MKKILSILLVLVLTVTCFFGCAPKKGSGSDLGDALNNISKLSDADATKSQLKVTLGVSLDQPMLSEATLSQLLGENAPLALSVLSPFIKNEKTAELPFSMEGIATKDGEGQFVMKLGAGEDALSCTAIVADEDVYVDAKSIYTWLGKILEPLMGGEAFPVWPYQNTYLSVMDLAGLFGIDMESGMAADAMVAQDAGVLSAISALNPEMLTAVIEGLMEAIPQQSLLELVKILETALKNAGMLASKNGYVTLVVNGDSVKKLPDALVAAADGKLALILDSVVEGIRSSENEIIASMIPQNVEIKGQDLEDQLIAGIQEGKSDIEAVAQQMKEMGYSVEIAVKAGKKAVDCLMTVQCGFDADGLSGKITLSASGRIEATKAVTVRAPGDVLTETEISNFLSAFMS